MTKIIIDKIAGGRLIITITVDNSNAHYSSLASEPSDNHSKLKANTFVVNSLANYSSLVLGWHSKASYNIQHLTFFI